jgi:hypothetical protein
LDLAGWETVFGKFAEVELHFASGDGAIERLAPRRLRYGIAAAFHAKCLWEILGASSEHLNQLRFRVDPNHGAEGGRAEIVLGIKRSEGSHAHREFAGTNAGTLDNDAFSGADGGRANE